MAVVQISKIINRKGSAADGVPQLDSGELGWAYDEKKLYIGNEPTEDNPTPGNTEIITSESISGELVPIATTTTVGVIRVGSGLEIDEFGTLSVGESSEPLPISKGGTGKGTRQGAINALAADTLTPNTVLRSDGANITLAKVALETDVSGVLPIANGGTGKSSVGPSGTYLRVNVAGTDLEYGEFPVASATVLGGIKVGNGLQIDGNSNLSTINNGTVTYIQINPGTTGLTFSGGPITSAGTFIVGGTLAAANGGTGASTLTGYVKGNGTDPFTASATIPFADISSKPTTIAGYGITDGATKAYVDTSDYLNFSPYAGYLKDNIVPIYGSFPFSQGAWSSMAFTFIDRESKQVLYFTVDTPTGNRSVARAYRYDITKPFVYDNNLVRPNFLSSTEKISDILNLGTYFVTLRVATIAYPQTQTRIVIAKTYGSSNSADWTFAYDVTQYANGRTNFALVPTSSGDRIITSTVASDSSQVVLTVYNNLLVQQRTQVLYDRAEMLNTSDTAGQGRVAPSNAPLLNYAPHGCISFTWNPFTQTFHQQFPIWYVYQNSAGNNVGASVALDLSWAIPKSWIENGTGTVSSLIPQKSGTFRYNLLKDSTWNTDTGGMSDTIGGAGVVPTLVTDEYEGNIYYSVRSTWTTIVAATIYRLSYSNAYVYKTFGNNNESKYTKSVEYIPDGSMWSKGVYSQFAHVINNNILFAGESSRYGQKIIQASFSTTEFSSVALGQTNDTLKLDPTTATVDPFNGAPDFIKNNGAPGAFGVTVSGTTPTYYWSRPGFNIHTITASSNNVRTYTDTGVAFPAIPATLGGKSGVTLSGITLWNGNTSTPILYATVRDSSGLVYMARYQNSAWSLTTANILQTEIDAGKQNRNDQENQIFLELDSGHPVWSNNGRILFNFSISTIGGRTFYWASYDINSAAVVTGDVTRFTPQSTGAGGYKPVFQWPGSTFGYSTTLGYYRASSTTDYVGMVFISSKDIRGVGAELTEDQWFNATATRYQIYLSTESSTGLVAYTVDYPLFIGGYYTSVPTQSVQLNPNATNYIYLVKNPESRNSVSIRVSDIELPNSFGRVLASKMVTNQTNILSQTDYIIRQRDTLDELLNVSTTNKQPGHIIAWNGVNWISARPTTGFDLFQLASPSPTPSFFPEYNIRGFVAYSSTDFPGNYFSGITISGQTDGLNRVYSSQLAFNWDDNGGTPTGVYFRTNDDTEDKTTWSPWRRILTDADIGSVSGGYTPVSQIDTSSLGAYSTIVGPTQVATNSLVTADGGWTRGGTVTSFGTVFDSITLNVNLGGNQFVVYPKNTSSPFVKSTHPLSGTWKIMSGAIGTTDIVIDFVNNTVVSGGASSGAVTMPYIVYLAIRVA